MDELPGVTTRSIWIDAPASDVWPWLAQMGPSPRGGAYTYDWIENLLGLNMHSTDQVLPEFQHPRPGDTISFGRNTMRLERVEPPHAFVWRSTDGNWVWSFDLIETDGRTHLISRNRYRLGRVAILFLRPASYVMERKMLRGIKRRAEMLRQSPPSPRSAQAAATPASTGSSAARGT